MDDVRLCCPECDYAMEDSEWKALKDQDGDLECPECEESLNYDDLVSEDLEPDEDEDLEIEDDDK